MSQIHHENDAINADSFVDIIASVVSIMLIMVMLIGMRIRHSAIDEAVSSHVEDIQREVDRQSAEQEAIRAETLAAAARIAEIEQWAKARAAHRELLLTEVAALQRELEDRRGRLDRQRREVLDLAQQVEQRRNRLAHLQQALASSRGSIAADAVVETLAVFPTPISRRVEGPEKHFQLRFGRITPVPLELLLRAAEQAARRKGLDRDGKLSDAVGPIGGFTMKYTVQLRPRDSDGLPVGGIGFTESRCEIYPTSETLGETIDEALQPHSAFQDELATCRPGRHTITLWVYPDTFEGFRKIRDELYRRQFAVAVWPLPENAPIAGSSDGERSSAQ